MITHITSDKNVQALYYVINNYLLIVCDCNMISRAAQHFMQTSVAVLSLTMNNNANT